MIRRSNQESDADISVLESGPDANIISYVYLWQSYLGSHDIKIDTIKVYHHWTGEIHDKIDSSNKTLLNEQHNGKFINTK